ncbi:hypothetical protein [Pseudomonas coronafaciens]|uniref:hypothetical protein n=1 Tax=Pseudomonas coronafaciens TaxID=53409 RepID=UPI00155D9C46|nr:hypothetical protein [Pseudomonas coronafaciens]
MAISLIRGLTASVTRNVSALKRDAKRLQKHSQLVFGTEYPLNVCQHAVAVARGFRSLADFENLTHRLGMNKEAPFWTIHGRSDTHQDVLDALYKLNGERSRCVHRQADTLDTSGFGSFFRANEPQKNARSNPGRDRGSLNSGHIHLRWNSEAWG